MESESAESSASASQFGVAGAWETVTAALVSRILIICELIVKFDPNRHSSFVAAMTFFPCCPCLIKHNSCISMLMYVADVAQLLSDGPESLRVSRAAPRSWSWPAAGHLAPGELADPSVLCCGA